MLGVNVVAADTDAEARFLASSGRQSFASLRAGRPIQLPPPSKEWERDPSDRDRSRPTRRACRSSGAPATIARQMHEFVERDPGRRADRRVAHLRSRRAAALLRARRNLVEFSAWIVRVAARPMEAHMLDGHLGRDDRGRSLRAVPVALVRRRGEPAAHARAARSSCSAPSASMSASAELRRTASWRSARAARRGLRRTQDMQRNTRFEYFRCPNDHGRLIDVLRLPEGEGLHQAADAAADRRAAQERPDRQLLELRRAGRSGEGLRRARIAARRCRCSTCTRPSGWSRSCAPPTAPSKTVDPALPLALARARAETESAFEGLPGHEPWDAGEMVAGPGRRRPGRIDPAAQTR